MGEQGDQKLQLDTGETPERSAPKRKAKARLLTVYDLDGRTRACKHALSLGTGFLSDLGGEDRASVAQQELAQRASILGAMLEDAEARWLKGDPIDPAAYATLTNAQRRVLADIGLERRARDVTPDLKSYLAAKGQSKGGEDAEPDAEAGV